MNELTEVWTREGAGRSKKEGALRRARGQGRPPKANFSSENEVVAERSKKIKKIIDDWVTILIFTTTSAEASRY